MRSRVRVSGFVSQLKNCETLNEARNSIKQNFGSSISTKRQKSSPEKEIKERAEEKFTEIIGEKEDINFTRIVNMQRVRRELRFPELKFLVRL